MLVPLGVSCLIRSCNLKYRTFVQPPCPNNGFGSTLFCTRPEVCAYRSITVKPSNIGHPKFWPGLSTTLCSSQVNHPTSPIYKVPGLPSWRKWLPVPGFSVIRNGLRNPNAQTLEAAPCGFAGIVIGIAWDYQSPVSGSIRSIPPDHSGSRLVAI